MTLDQTIVGGRGIKQAVLGVMAAKGVFTPFRLANREKTLILTYHRFHETGADGALSAAAFAEQLEYLRAHYSLISLSALREILERGASLPPGAAVITIDDGYRDAYEIAFPLLRRYGAPATVFVVTGFLDGCTWLWPDQTRCALLSARTHVFQAEVGGRLVSAELRSRDSRLQAAASVNEALKELPEAERTQVFGRILSSLGVELPERPPAEFGPVSWDQAREMDAAGVEIGSHTLTHPILTRVADEQLRWELRQSRARLEDQLQRPVDLFCYPNGNYDERVQAEVARAGYRCAVTTDIGFNRADTPPLSLRRIHTAPDLPHFVQSTSGFEAWKDRLRQSHRSLTLAAR
jgi:peptidoglycan/xylan/chitin deacetylase (PgdA/CDA1 family)